MEGRGSSVANGTIVTDKKILPRKCSQFPRWFWYSRGLVELKNCFFDLSFSMDTPLFWNTAGLVYLEGAVTIEERFVGMVKIKIIIESAPNQLLPV